MITGNDLIALGYKPSRWFKDAIVHINLHNLEGQEMIDYVKSVVPVEVPMLSLKKEPVNYHENIIADTDVEKENLNAVKQSMDVIMRTPTVVAGAIMPDACPAGSIGTIPVGGVVVSKNAIHPGMHSADICCSVFLTDLGKVEPKSILDMAHSVTHFGIGGRPRGKQFKLPEDIKNE